MANIEVVSGVSDEAYPEIFDIRAMLPQSDVKKPGQLTDDQLKHYFKEGYVVLNDFFTKEELEPCRKTTEDLVDDLAKRLHKAGKISDLYEGYGLFERLTKLEEEFPGANVVLHKIASMPEAYCNIWAHERLLNVVEQLIGPDIAGNPVWNLRTKTPQNDNTTVPWHQDSGYTDNDSYKMLIPTAWIPLLDSNEVNGCMEFAVRGHKTGRIATHKSCWKDTWYIWLEEEEMKNTLGVDLDKDLKVIPIPYGGLVLFQNLIPHRSLANRSKDIRWSLDLRWQKSDGPDGFWGIKKPIIMRKKDDPNFKIDWSEFNSVTRHMTVEEEFDTTIPGPWMKKWELVHTNKHTDAFFAEQTHSV